MTSVISRRLASPIEYPIEDIEKADADDRDAPTPFGETDNPFAMVPVIHEAAADVVVLERVVKFAEASEFAAVARTIGLERIHPRPQFFEFSFFGVVEHGSLSLRLEYSSDTIAWKGIRWQTNGGHGNSRQGLARFPYVGS